MPTFSFEGIETGAPVALSVTQGALSRSDSLAGWATTPTASFALDVQTANVVVAPAQLRVQAFGINGFDVDDTSASHYDPSFHKLRWVSRVQKLDPVTGWQDDPLPDWTAPQNMLDEWNDPNRRFTKRATFVVTEPGTYRIVTRAIQDKDTYTDEIASDPVTVASQAATYVGNRTIVYSEDPNEDWENAPQNAVQVTTNAALLAALDRNGPRRILFKRGQTYTLTERIVGGSRYLTHIGAWGNGSDPVIEAVPSLTSGIVSINDPDTPDTQFTVENIVFQTDWDPTTERGRRQSFVDFRWLPNGSTVTLHNVTMLGATGINLGTSGNADPTRGIFVAVHDTVFENFADFGSFTSGNVAGQMAVLGCRFNSHPDALHGNRKNVLANHHGPIRIAHCLDVEITGCDMFSNSGWSGGIQPTLRLLTSGDADDLGAIYSVNRCVLEGGNAQITTAMVQNQSTDGNWLFDQILLIGNALSRRGIDIFYSGVTVRNCYAWYPDVEAAPSSQDFEALAFFTTSSATPTANYTVPPNEVYNCTTYCGISAAKEEPSPTVLTAENDTSVLTIVEENNILHQPNTSTVYAANAPIDLTQIIAGVTPRFTGYRTNYAPVVIDNAEVVPGGKITVDYANILRQDRHGQGPGTAVTQTFLQGLAGNRHHVGDGEYQWFFADDGDIALTFNATSLEIENTSSETWDGSIRYLMLDMNDQLDTDLPRLTNLASPATIERPLPQIGSDRETATGTLIAQTDFFGATRGGFLDPDSLAVVNETPVGGAIDALG